jgi:hypothetical protein
MRIENEFKKLFFLSGLLHLLAILVFGITLGSPGKRPTNELSVFFYGTFMNNLNTVRDAQGISTSSSNLDRQIMSMLSEEPPPDTISSYQNEVFYLTLDKPRIELERYVRKPLSLKVKEAYLDKMIKVGSASKRDLSKKLDWRNMPFEKSVVSPLNWAGDEENFSFRMRVFVSPEGKIEFVEPMFFSGEPEIDLLAKKSIKEWSFIPDENLAGWYEIDYSPPRP